MIEITEQIIAEAKLSKEEAKVIRVVNRLPSAGKRTKRWAAALGMKKYDQLLRSAGDKLRKILRAEEAKGSES